MRTDAPDDAVVLSETGAVFVEKVATADDEDDDKDDDGSKDPKAKDREKKQRDEARAQERKARAGERRTRIERAEVDPKTKAEIDKARAELKDAEARLRDAAKRLAELETRAGGQLRYRVIERLDDKAAPGSKQSEVRVFRFNGPPGADNIKHPVPPVPPVPPGPPGHPASPDTVRFYPFPGQNPDTDKRINELEKKLDRVLDELKDLKKTRTTEGQTTSAF